MTRSYRPDYPRPQFTRPDWENLNGEWDFAFDDEDAGEGLGWQHHLPVQRKITVPFSYESPASGIGDEKFHPVVWYQRALPPRKSSGERVILHFEGSDYFTKVWINGNLAGSHQGGYSRFSFDISDLLEKNEKDEKENLIVVRVLDSNDRMQPRGKQRWKSESFGCWYVQTTGIWKTVWLEYRSGEHIERVRQTPLLNKEKLKVEWQVCAYDYDKALEIEAEVYFKDIFVSKINTPVMKNRGEFLIDVACQQVHQWGLRTWSPNDPALYDIRYRLLRDGKELDEAWSYFGMREIRIEGDVIFLNGRPLYQRLILDQGYWQDSHLTPPDEAALISDIDNIIAFGYNGVRKHQKIEDDLFYYWCDVKGLLAWCEMPSAYEFGADAVSMFTREWTDIVNQHYNHPSIITWTPFNESWGISDVYSDQSQQKFTEAIYNLTKALDPMRPVVVNDGWEHTVSDIITLHDYEEKAEDFLSRYQGRRDEILSGKVAFNKSRMAFAKGYSYKGQPVMISEYGGAAFSGGKAGEWGYGRAIETKEQLAQRIVSMTKAIESLPWVCGYCYTQVSDVQQEINGLLSGDRKQKLAPELIRPDS
ncbi:MAG: glycoside hydrolase family 2 protein [Christensenellales bacterium]|jgi:beta-galactosidase/beta-glucuronidase